MLARVISAVSGFEPMTDRERGSKERFLNELGRLSAPFDRQADAVHVTGSAIVWGERGTVLHLHKRQGLWLQPGGHIDAGEAPWDAALRETAEETGLLVEHPGGVPEFFHLDVHVAGQHLHLDLRYLVEGANEEPRPGPGESPDVRWFDLAEALAIADDGLVDALERLRSRVS